MKLFFKDYAHDGYMDSETVEMLTEMFNWPKEEAEKYVKNNKPMYEVEAQFEWDSETDTLTVLGANVNGTELVPK